MNLYIFDKSQSSEKKFDLESLMRQYQKNVCFEDRTGDVDDCVSIIESTHFSPSQYSGDSVSSTYKRYRSRSRRKTKAGEYFTNFTNINQEIIIEESEPLYEPTYQLEPSNRIDISKLEIEMKLSLRDFLTDINIPNTVNSQATVELCLTDLTNLMKSRLKSLKKDGTHIVQERYKLVINCTLVEKKHQGCIVTSECLWNNETDARITVRESRDNYEFIVNLFAIYHE